MILNLNKPQFPAAQRSAFTLLEVMISTALSSVVMLLVYSSLDVSAKLSKTGTDALERDAVARGVLFRIHDDLKSVSDSHATYLDDYTREVFDSQTQRITELQTALHDPTVWVSDSFLMVRKDWHLPRTDFEIEAADPFAGLVKCVAYFSSAESFGIELAESFKTIDKQLQMDGRWDVNPIGLHRCLLIQDPARTHFQLVAVDPDYERTEVQSLTFEIFDGEQWRSAAENESGELKAVRTSLTLSQAGKNAVQSLRPISVRESSTRNRYSLKTRIQVSNVIEGEIR
ncbi:MAG: prepilin-type N-terminal cleavage/methylation domain-containing protein [Planctomycetota bacterium]|nr:prepilin-type N-terminal cleavage/methylation domain-containing protein [Planctomycetota bacterium]